MKGALVGRIGFLSLQNYYPFIPLPSKVYFINYLPMKLNLSTL